RARAEETRVCREPQSCGRSGGEPPRPAPPRAAPAHPACPRRARLLGASPRVQISRGRVFAPLSRLGYLAPVAITTAEVERVAALARLKLEPHEVERLTTDLGKLLDAFQRPREVDNARGA